MGVLRWDPFAELASLRERVNRVFEESMRPEDRREQSPARAWAPLVDIYETPAEIVVEADLAGVKQDDIEIQVMGDTLTLRGERKDTEGRNYVRVERPYGPFSRSFTIGTPIDQAGVKARYKDGVLEITLPKAEEAKPKQVKVQVD